MIKSVSSQVAGSVLDNIVAQVAEEVFEESAQMGMKLRAPLAHGILASLQDQQHIFRLETNIWFPQVSNLRLIQKSVKTEPVSQCKCLKHGQTLLHGDHGTSAWADPGC